MTTMRAGSAHSSLFALCGFSRGISLKTSDFIKQHPICCFCGGGTPATTVDHQPAKIHLSGEGAASRIGVPGVERCNKQTSVDKCILAFVSRLTGSLRVGWKLDEGLERALQTVSTACPQLLPSMDSATLGARKMPALDVNKKEINEGLCRIAAKLAIATYYAETGNIVLPGSRINAIWTHNQRRDTAGDVHDLLTRFPRSKFRFPAQP
jgi:hypothetical protein